MQRYAAWRERPASAKAIALLLKMRGIETVEGADKRILVRAMSKLIDPAQLTAGEVSALVCATKRGAAVSLLHDSDQGDWHMTNGRARGRVWMTKCGKPRRGR